MFFSKEIDYKSDLGYEETVKMISENIESDYSLEMAIKHKKPKKPFIGVLNNNGTFEFKNVQMNRYRNMSHLEGLGKVLIDNGTTTINVKFTFNKGLRNFIILVTVFSLVLLLFAHFLGPLLISFFVIVISIRTCYQEFKIIKKKLDVFL